MKRITIEKTKTWYFGFLFGRIIELKGHGFLIGIGKIMIRIKV